MSSAEAAPEGWTLRPRRLGLACRSVATRAAVVREGTALGSPIGTSLGATVMTGSVGRSSDVATPGQHDRSSGADSLTDDDVVGDFPVQSQDERRRELARDIFGAAYRRGDFVLSSGVRSDFFFDKYLFATRPSILRRIASHCVSLIPRSVDRIAGPELGAVALATALSLESGLPFVIVRKGSVAQASRRPVEGELYRGERVLVVEDVVSSGSQALAAAAQLRTVGADVQGVLCIIDREQGGAERIQAKGYEFKALFTRSDLRF